MSDRKSWSKRLSLVLALALAWSGYALLWDADASVSDPGKCLETPVAPYALAMPVMVPVILDWAEHAEDSNIHFNTSQTHNSYSVSHTTPSLYHDSYSEYRFP